MSHYPCYGMAALCTTGGIAEYTRTRAVPPLAASLGVGVMYGAAAYLLKEKNDFGDVTGLAASTVMAKNMIPKAIKTQKPCAVALAICSLATGAYYA